MNVRNFIDSVRDDESAVSPVIGVILMVAITVILAAVIGTFVLGLGEEATSGTAPTANFNFDYESSGAGNVTVSHGGGDTIDADRLTTLYNGQDITDQGETGFQKEVTAGSSITISGDTVGAMAEGDTVTVVWSSSDGSSSAELGNFEVPSNSDKV